jgi:hypothetical protein
MSKPGGDAAARGRDHSKLVQIGDHAGRSARIDAGVGKIEAENSMSAALSIVYCSEFSPLPVGG